MSEPYLSDSDFTLYQGDALEVLRTLPDGSVHMCVTSPPFYGLRDYGTGSWVGGDPGCDHKASTGEPRKFTNGRGEGTDDEYAGSNLRAWTTRDGTTYGGTCGKCGARRVDQQIGLEETPEQWVEKLVGVFREVRRVLRSDGTLWLEVGDSYANTPAGNKTLNLDIGNARMRQETADALLAGAQQNKLKGSGLKQKDLIGAPWMLAFALRADGWFLRSDIVWSRPNPMPESVTDRPTKSHSYVFLLSKSPRYFWDQEAIREKLAVPLHAPGNKTANGEVQRNDFGTERMGEVWGNPAGRNVRSVWDIPTQPYPEAHFATYPEELVRRCILAGTSERGCCPECGAPWVRQTETVPIRDQAPGGPRAGAKLAGRQEQGLTSRRTGLSASNSHNASTPQSPIVKTLGWVPSCGHDEGLLGKREAHEKAGRGGQNNSGQTAEALVSRLPSVPCTVLDPFMGSGTTALVARKHGRRTIGIELSSDYCELAARRLAQQSLFA